MTCPLRWGREPWLEVIAFAMEEVKKPRIPRKLFKIGEIMEYTGLSRQTLHNYTMMGLLREEARTESGHRLYAEDVFERIERIKELREKKTLKEVLRVLKAEPTVPQRGAE
jgi:DNA-binding transcriptional MerR regulator